MKIRIEDYTKVYFDTEDKKLYAIVEYEDLDMAHRKTIICISEVIK